MSKVLAKLLEQPERLVAKTIAKLESANGYHSEDVRYLAENSQALRARLNDLGLDPDDTTSEELYQALLAKFDRDSALIDTSLGVGSDTNLSSRADKAIQLVGHTTKPREAWVLKQATAKKLIRQQPPKKLMKKLNYRSAESLLKRQNITSIYLALPFVESASWQKNFAKQLTKLSTTDYEPRAIELAILPAQLGSVKGPGSMVSSNLVLGAVGLWPSAALQQARVLSLALILLNGLENLTHSEATESIAHLHPALLSWDQSKQLIACLEDDPVSFNYLDVALDHLTTTHYSRRGRQHGQQSLWSALAQRYRRDMAAVGETWTALENNASEDFNQLINQELAAKPALEYQEAIANEL